MVLRVNIFLNPLPQLDLRNKHDKNRPDRPYDTFSVLKVSYICVQIDTAVSW